MQVNNEGPEAEIKSQHPCLPARDGKSGYGGGEKKSKKSMPRDSAFIGT